MQELMGMWWLFGLTGFIFMATAISIINSKKHQYKTILALFFIIGAIMNFGFTIYLLVQSQNVGFR